MKIERIGANKIKVLINRDDVKTWNVNLKNFTDNTPEAQDLFWFALKQAEQDVDFNVGKAQLLVETAATANDGFIMIISKLENESEVAEVLLHAGKRIRQTEMKLSRKPKDTPLMRIFRFDDFEILCSGISEINELYLGESRVYKYRDSFYLELCPNDSFGFFEIENILSEFAVTVKRPAIIKGILNEHGTPMIAADAVDIIMRNFVR